MQLRIDHAKRFIFRVVASDPDGDERYFGYRWTYWGAMRLAKKVQKQIDSGQR